MRALLLVLVLGIVGCGGGDGSASDQPKVEGKVEIKEMPAGTKAPGDERPSGETGGTRDGG